MAPALVVCKRPLNFDPSRPERVVFCPFYVVTPS